MTAVVAIALAAALDAARRSSADSAPSPEPSTANPNDAARALRAVGVTGRLIYTDERCELRAIALPDLVPTARPLAVPETGCAFAVTPTNQRALSAGSTWNEDGRLLARCRGGTTYVTVVSERGVVVGEVPGCAPAWTPDGRLTVIRDGELVTPDRTLLSRIDLYDAARRHPSVPDSPQFLDDVEAISHAWLTPTRVAVLLRIRLAARLRRTEALSLVALFERGRLAATHTTFGAPRPLGLFASPRRTYVVAYPGLVLRRNGDTLSLPEWLVGVRKIAFSPDERWLAVATRRETYVLGTAELERFDRTRRSPRTIRVGIVARDLTWR